MKDELKWLEESGTIILKQETLKENVNVSWSAFHSHQPSCTPPTSTVISVLLPLFPDQAKSVAMIKHAMDVIKLSVNHLNPGQVPVIALDQPLYAVVKEIQWRMRDNNGEDKFVMVFSGLHVEQAFLKVNGQWLKNSRWTAALVDATQLRKLGRTNPAIRPRF